MQAIHELRMTQALILSLRKAAVARATSPPQEERALGKQPFKTAFRQLQTFRMRQDADPVPVYGVVVDEEVQGLLDSLDADLLRIVPLRQLPDAEVTQGIRDEA